VEAAADCLVAEALTNVTKYAQASVARVRVARENGHALVEIVDDGIGGADSSRAADSEDSSRPRRRTSAVAGEKRAPRWRALRR
jgi:signal transduction histidine kinase